MILTGTVRLGRDAELKYLPSGDAVITLSLAYNYGKKDDSGNRPTTWIRASLFGKRAESLAQHLVKGTQLWVVLNEVRLSEFQKKEGGSGAAIEARIEQLDFIGSREQSSAPAPQRQAPPPQRQPAQSIEDMDSDIPF